MKSVTAEVAPENLCCVEAEKGLGVTNWFQTALSGLMVAVMSYFSINIVRVSLPALYPFGSAAWLMVSLKRPALPHVAVLFINLLSLIAPLLFADGLVNS